MSLEEKAPKKFSREVYIYHPPAGFIDPMLPEALALTDNMADIAREAAIAGKPIRVGVYVLEKFVDVHLSVVVQDVIDDGG